MFKKKGDNKFPESETPLIVFLQGNTGNIGERIPYFKQLIERIGVNVLTIAYRGYSNSGGSPREEGIQQDAEAITEFLLHPE